MSGAPVACMAAGAPELIEILYDQRYADAGWMLQLLALGTWLTIPQTLSGAVLLALAAPRWFAIGNGLKFAGMVVLLPLGYTLAGDAGAIAGLAGAELEPHAAGRLGSRALLVCWKWATKLRFLKKARRKQIKDVVSN